MTSELKALWQLAFGDSPDFIEGFFRTAYSPERCRFLCREGRVAAALYWLDGEYLGRKFAYIYAVATHPDFRGRGLCRELMGKAQEALHRQGYAAALLFPAEESLRQMYGKLGYRDCCTASEFFCAAGGEPVSLREITEGEFARLRRTYLPKNALIQEGASLSYLHSYCKFYAGRDFLLTAVRDGSTLFAPELLGDSKKAPGILTALGCTEGTFRTPGNEKSTAMGLPLAVDVEFPEYLGFVFD